MTPRFPLYIPSKGRYEYMMTSKALTEMGVSHYVVAEPQEVALYQEAVKRFNLKATIVPLDMSYKSKYELCDDLGLSKSTGPGPARNFAWEHSISNGFDWHWVMDDNIRYFQRMNKSKRIRCQSGSLFTAMEDFTLRYKNVAMSGPCYSMFAFRAKMETMPPFIINTRIYSCNFIRNDIPFRWRGRYNEDTILSLDVLKANWCTLQFYAFLQNKINTQTMKGGNTQEFYAKEGTTDKSAMQVKVHPDCSKITMKYGRVHHHVDYLRFKQKPVLRDDIEITEAPNEYGMKLKIG